MKFPIALFTFALSIFSFCALAQPVAVITDLQHEVKLYANLRSVLSEESFTDYFTTDKAWAASMVNKINVLAGQKTGATSVKGKQIIQYIISNKSNISSIPFIYNDSIKADFFVKVVSTTHLLTTAIDAAGMIVKNFNHTCMVDITDQKGETVFSSRVMAPFRTTVKPGVMHGMAELSRQDFEALYEKTLHAAFENQAKKLPLTTFFRPPFESETYLPFLQNASYYTMQESVPDMPLQKGEARNCRLVVKSANGTVHNTMALTQHYSGNASAADGSFHTRATLKNDLLETTYQIWVTLNAGNTDGNGYAYPNKQATVGIRCTEQGLIAGDYMLTSSKFEGKSGYDVYTINRIMPKNTIELLINNQVKAIIQKGGISDENGKWQNYYIYFSKELNATDMGNLLDIFLMYKLAYEYGQDYIIYY